MSDPLTTAIQEDKRPYQNFIHSLKSLETKQEYRKCLIRYLSHYKKSVENMLSLPIDKIENMLVDYLLDLKKQDLLLVTSILISVP